MYNKVKDKITNGVELDTLGKKSKFSAIFVNGNIEITNSKGSICTFTKKDFDVIKARFDSGGKNSCKASYYARKNTIGWEKSEGNPSPDFSGYIAAIINAINLGKL